MVHLRVGVDGFKVAGEAPSRAPEAFDEGDGKAPGRSFIRPSERPDTTPRVAP